MNQVVIVGATGRIGRPLCAALAQRGYRVVVFSHDPSRAQELVGDAAAYVAWSPAALPAACVDHLGSADAVVFLAGGSLFDGHRHSRQDVENESAARASALGSLVGALGQLDRRPNTFIAASSVSYYGYAPRPDTPLDETHPARKDWWGRSSEVIEQTALAAQRHGVRTAVLRTGYVLTADSLASQVGQFHRHFGGWIGTGRGWTSWIHITDEVGMIVRALEDSEVDGPINATAHEPVRSRQFAQILGNVLDRRAWSAVPTPFVRMGLGAVTDILVKGQQVIRAKALATGYRFSLPTLDGALQDLLDGEPKTEKKR